MKIHILLPYKEKFDKNKSSSVSITVKNNLLYTKYLNNIKIYGQDVENPLFKDNFVGLKYSFLSFKSKNKFLAYEMLKIISLNSDKNQLIEIHNRPYLINQIVKKTKFPISLFFHNDPQTMKGSKSIKDRQNILKNCNSIFCVSEFIKNKFLEGIKSNFEKIHVLQNGVERKIKQFPTKEKKVLFVGRLVPEKGVDLYVNVVKDIAFKFPDWKFGLIGSPRLGENKTKGLFVDNLIKEFQRIGSQVQFHGFKNQNFVQEQMKTASIIVIPSIWEEPFGLVAAEAMSNGIAIIASKMGGIPEIVKENGILVENVNKSNIRDELEKLINNSSKRKFFQKASWDNFTLHAKKTSRKLDKFREKILFS